MTREKDEQRQKIYGREPNGDRAEAFEMWKYLTAKRPNTTITTRTLSTFLKRNKGWKVPPNVLNRWREEDQWEQRYFGVQLEAEERADEIEIQALAQDIAARRVGERKVADRALNGALRLLASAIDERVNGAGHAEPLTIAEIAQVTGTIEKLQRVRDRSIAPLFELPAPGGEEGEGGDGVPALTLQAGGVGIASIIEQLNRIAQPKPLSQIIDVTPEPEGAE